jgi:hypothetical protein
MPPLSQRRLDGVELKDREVCGLAADWNGIGEGDPVRLLDAEITTGRPLDRCVPSYDVTDGARPGRLPFD